MHCVICMTDGKVRLCKIIIGSSVTSKTFSPASPDADHWYRQRSYTEQAHPMTLQRFRHWAFSVCFTALIEQHKEETSIRRTARRRKQRNSHFDMLISFTSHLGSWVWWSRKGNRNRTNKERRLEHKLKSGLGLVWPWRKMIFCSHDQNHWLFLLLSGPK